LLFVLAVGAVATNVIGRRVVSRAESWLMMIPVFRTIYSPVKQLVAAFSPDNKYGFKRVVMIDDPGRGWVMGFLTREFTVVRDGRTDTMMAVYVPTNHLYLGDVVLVPRDAVVATGLSIEDGIRIILSAGTAAPPRLPHGSAGELGAAAK
jgi:uncharacterized membrane protein